MTHKLCKVCGNHPRAHSHTLCCYCRRKKNQWNRWRRIMIKRDEFPIYDGLRWTDYRDCWDRVKVVRQL